MPATPHLHNREEETTTFLQQLRRNERINIQYCEPEMMLWVAAWIIVYLFAALGTSRTGRKRGHVRSTYPNN